MAEKSYLWTTGGAGDGSATYTRLDWAVISKILATVHGNEGVAPSLGNALSGTVPATNTVRINTGGALVDGKPYYNDSVVDVTIPSAVGAGNTRIDRVVLRADWTAQTVRVTRVAGTDATNPSAPAITQTSGTTYDIYLYKALVDTSGNVSLTDERSLALLDNSDMGNQVPVVAGRQGGSPTQWTTGGTSNFTPEKLKIQVGSYSVPEGWADSITVTFPEAFSGTPLVFANPANVNVTTFGLENVNTTSFTGYATQATGFGGGAIYWIAIGPRA